MKATPTIKRHSVSADEIRGDVAAWKRTHPGFDELNYADAFRDERGDLIESDAFFAAERLFSRFRLLP